MTTPTVEAQAIWVSEHYWPGVAEELVLAQAQRLAHADGWISSIVLAGQQTAFGLFVADAPGDVHQAVARVGLSAGVVSPAWRLSAVHERQG